jgi:hypothetical protein
MSRNSCVGGPHRVGEVYEFPQGRRRRDGDRPHVAERFEVARKPHVGCQLRIHPEVIPARCTRLGERPDLGLIREAAPM